MIFVFVMPSAGGHFASPEHRFIDFCRVKCSITCEYIILLIRTSYVYTFVDSLHDSKAVDMNLQKQNRTKLMKCQMEINKASQTLCHQFEFNFLFNLMGIYITFCLVSSTNAISSRHCCCQHGTRWAHNSKIIGFFVHSVVRLSIDKETSFHSKTQPCTRASRRRTQNEMSMNDAKIE